LRKYLAGIATGLVIGLTAPLAAAQLVGDTGYLRGWSVTKGGEEVCYMPYVWVSSKEIECD
jgi:hypothetical protein